MTADFKVLIADDSPSDRLLLEALVKQAGYRVIAACDGVEAIELFHKESPDIVLLDALMPRKDGFQVAKEIKDSNPEEVTPIIFLTSLVDTESLVKCLDAGGDDFLSKPYNGVILKAKIRAMARLREMHQSLQHHRDQIAANNEHLVREQVVAKQVFDNIAHTGCLGANNIRYSLSPMAVFNGDVIVAGMRPNGSMVLLLGDFTGHGLPAAMGAMPLASTFYGMVHKGFSMTDILREINQKLNQTLPVGIFCCAAVVEMNFIKQTAKLWNGGLPGLVHRKVTGELVELDSKHLPLGVVSDEQFKSESLTVAMELGDQIMLWSDGIIEARSESGEMFGHERVMSCLSGPKKDESGFDLVLEALQKYAPEEGQDDDVSLLEMTMVELESLTGVSDTYFKSTDHGLSEWNLSLELKPSSLHSFDPLPLLVNVLVEVPDLREHSGTLYSILAELYSNALEHGVLGLESELKNNTDGFSRYYQLRKQRIESLKEGWIRFELGHSVTDNGGVLSISVEDSGEGFNPDSSDEKLENQYSGRGITLLRKLCHSVSYDKQGSRATVEYLWSRQ